MDRIKICLLAPPYSGHFNPLIGLGRKLQEVAEVTMLSTPGAMRWASAAGVRGYPILKDGEKIVMDIASPGKSVKGNPLLLFRQLKANVSLQVELLRELEEAFAELKPDLVIADFTLPVAGEAAARCGAKWWTHLPSPCVFETIDGPPAYFGGLSPADSWPEKAVHFFLRKLTRVFKRLMYLMFRKTFRQVGIGSIYRADGSERVYSPELILAAGIEEVEFPRTYPSHFRWIGPSLYTPPGESLAPEFLPGKRHLLVTLGSHLKHRKNEIAEEMRKIARNRPDWVFHFTDGRASRDLAERDGNFHRYPFISYDDFLDRYDLVIHHGGSGIFMHCLKLGIPALVIPMDFDQFDNAARLVAAGLARSVKNISEIGLALDGLAAEEEMAGRCRQFSGIVARYDAGAAVLREIRAAFPMTMDI